MKSNNWTRKHDRIIAERCEGLTTVEPFHGGDYRIVRRFQQTAFGETWDSASWTPLPHYNTDIAACFRAAEAWRRQQPGRKYAIYSAVDGPRQTYPPIITLLDSPEPRKYVSETLHEALYEAVKDA